MTGQQQTDQQLDLDGKTINREPSVTIADKETTVLPEILGLPPLMGPINSEITGSDNPNVEIPDWVPDTDVRTLRSETPKNLDDVIIDSMPIMELVPVKPNFVLGPALYQMKPAMGKVGDKESFAGQLHNLYNIQLNPNRKQKNSIKICIQNTSFPVVDSFTNTFKESMANKLADTVGSSGDMMRELNVMFNKEIGDVSKYASEVLQGFGMSKEEQAAGAGFFKGKEGMSEFDKKVGLSAGAIGRMFAKGDRIDFPQIWNNSSWAPTYNANIRLYNPHPGDPKYTMQHLIAPLVTILMFAVPYSTDGVTYSAPWLCQFKVPGIYDLKAGFISDISVMKGGDDNHIAFNQVPGIIDIKLTFGTLFNTMVSANKSSPSITGSDRPTIHSYIEPMIKNPKQFVNDSNVDENGFSVNGPKWAYSGYYEDGNATSTRWQADVPAPADSTNTGKEFAPVSRQSFSSRVKQFAKDHASLTDFLTGGNT